MTFMKKKATLRAGMLGERSKTAIEIKRIAELMQINTLKKELEDSKCSYFLVIYLAQRKQVKCTVYHVTLFFIIYKTDFR